MIFTKVHREDKPSSWAAVEDSRALAYQGMMRSESSGRAAKHISAAAFGLGGALCEFERLEIE
jgi:hypothetical protein